VVGTHRVFNSLARIEGEDLVTDAPLRVVLFDIDHTLLASGGAGFRAMDRALFELFGIEGATRGMVPHGKTDPMLFSEALRAHGIIGVDDGEPYRELVRLYQLYLPEEMTAPPARLMPGARELIETIDGRPGVLLGLLTGNLEPTARVKLATFGLDRHFRFGAFGSDDRDRLKLVPIAVERAEALAGRRIGLGPHVMVVGDTPRDVACALAWGATAVGVATGRSSSRELLDAGANFAFEDLSDTAGFMGSLRL
jgi:phosphoglycolate phosphatase-like HAD superfamily hydrolase